MFKTYPKDQEATFFVVKNYVFYNKKSELSDFLGKILKNA